jgi:hypothetical protein
MTLTAAGLFFCAAGAGRISVDHALDLDGFGWPTALGCAALGIAGAAGLLVGFWRPTKKA